jgi:hypothetical protein
MLSSPSHAIKLLGGAKVVASRVSRPYTTVSSWASRQSIPASAWSELIEFAKEKEIEGFTYEALAKAHVQALN